MSHDIIDLTQDDSDDDSIGKESPDMPLSAKLKSRPVTFPETIPMPKFPTDNLLTMPLMNISRSVSYAFSPSNMDPFANLVRLLHQKRDSDNSLFFELTQALASSGDATELLPSLFSLIQSDIPLSSALGPLAIHSMTVLSVNNQAFSEGVLQKHELLLELSEKCSKEFLADVLSLFEVVCEFATEDQARSIIAHLHRRDLINHRRPDTKGTVDPIRAQTHSVLTLLARYGNVFPYNLVYDIMKRCNYPGKGELYREIVLPSIITVEMFLRQPDSEAYKALKKHKDELLGKLALALAGCEKHEDVDLKISVMKVFMAVCDEFRVEDLPSSLNEFHFRVTATLISMQTFAEEPVKRMAEILLDRFNI